MERRDGVPLANGRRSYLVVLLEFQSEADPDTAWRMHEHLYLLGLNQWQAYVVVDYPTLAGDHAFMRRLPLGNRQAALIRLESAPSNMLPRLLGEAFRRWSGPESTGLRRGFHARAEHLLRRRGLALPPLSDYERMLAQEQGANEMTTPLRKAKQTC